MIMITYEIVKIVRGKYLERCRRVVKVQKFWEFAQNCMHRLAARGLPPGAITQVWIYVVAGVTDGSRLLGNQVRATYGVRNNNWIEALMMIWRSYRFEFYD